ncbi:MAG TPA: bile acid:sodium symporter family protein [Bacteroidales bacterium]|nr:bile acid:sodium symporter family protein [Bacteroidales bacterium]
MFEALQLIDATRLNFSEGGLFILNIAIAFIMFGVALEIKVDHFLELIKNPKPVLLGVVSQFVLLPFITTALVFAFWNNLTVGVAMGMILVASCPGGNVSNFISTFARGNAALSVSLTAIATIAAIVMTPLNFFIWGSVYSSFGPHAENSLLKELYIDPVAMFRIVLILLGVPILIGMLTNGFFPKLTEKIKKPIWAFSIVFFVGMLVVLFINNYDHFIKHIYWIFIIVLLHNGLALTTGYSVASLFRQNLANRKTISIETGIQNSALGLVLIFNPAIFPANLPTGGMAIVAAWWGIWHIVAGMGLAFFWRYRSKADAV